MGKFFHGTARVKLAAAMAFSVAAGSGALAHHSYSMFDFRREVVLDAVVHGFKWANPHPEISLVVVQDGKQVEYEVELEATNAMRRQGWSRNSLKAGDKGKFTIHPRKDGTKAGSFKRAVLANGTVLTTRGAPGRS